MSNLLLGHQPAKRPQQSWLVTFTDLLGLVLAMFVLIYATSDRKADKLHQAVLTLQSTLFVQPGGDRRNIIADVMSPSGYQTALLQRFVDDMPYWSLDADDEKHLIMKLEGQSLGDAIGDGTWLDIVERFERNVSLTAFFGDPKDAKKTYEAVQDMQNLRDTRGLTTDWAVSVKAAPDGQSLRARIDIATANQSGFLELTSKKVVAAPTKSEAE